MCVSGHFELWIHSGIVQVAQCFGKHRNIHAVLRYIFGFVTPTAPNGLRAWPHWVWEACIGSLLRSPDGGRICYRCQIGHDQIDGLQFASQSRILADVDESLEGLLGHQVSTCGEISVDEDLVHNPAHLSAGQAEEEQLITISRRGDCLQQLGRQL